MKESREEKGYSRVTCRVITKKKDFMLLLPRILMLTYFKKGKVSIDIVGSILWQGIKLTSAVVNHTIKLSTTYLDVKRVHSNRCI